MITWNVLSKKLDDFESIKDFDWSTCKGIEDIDLKGIPDKNIINVIDNYISSKIQDDDNREECRKVKNLNHFEKTIYCSYRYYLEQMNDGFWAVFTGYMSPLLFEIRKALKEINASVNLKQLEDAIQKVNAENKSDEDFLADVENEELDWLYDDETEEEYSDYLHKLDSNVYDNEEDVQDLILAYIHKNTRS